MRLGAVLTLPRIFQIFLEFILIFPRAKSIYYKALKSFYQLQTLYLDSSCPNVSLGIFLEFLGFSKYF
jgi:hypothetical protein